MFVHALAYNERTGALVDVTFDDVELEPGESIEPGDALKLVVPEPGEKAVLYRVSGDD